MSTDKIYPDDPDLKKYQEEFKPKTIQFHNYPDFRPNITPREVILLGSFGGTYFRPIRSGVTRKKHGKLKEEDKEVLKDKHKEFAHWWRLKNRPLDSVFLTTPWHQYHRKINRYKKKAGQTLEAWEDKNWITSWEPYGWFQWYCRFYKRKIEDQEKSRDVTPERRREDERQIGRWMAFTGHGDKEGKGMGRWKRRLLNLMKDQLQVRMKGRPDSDLDKNIQEVLKDTKISPVIRQSLQHWGYQITKEDLKTYYKKNTD